MQKGKKIQISRFLYRKLKPHLHQRRIKQMIRTFRVVSGEELDRLCDAYYIKMIRCILMIFGISCVLGCIFFVREQNADPRVVLERDTYGGEESEVSVETVIDGETQVFDIEVLPLTYDAKSVQKAFADGFDYLDEVYLGENESADCITRDLKLVDEIEELGLTVSWDTGDQDCINYKGEIVEGTLANPTLVNLTATLAYEDYEAVRLYPVMVAGKEKDAATQVLDRIRSAVTELQQAAGENATLTLPEQVEGYPLKKKSGIRHSVLIFLTGLILCFGITYKNRKNLQLKEQKRNEELVSAYPAFIDIMVLYMGAGLTVKGALERVIVLGDSRLLSEELRYAMNEIQSGISETEAYYRLGNRLNLPIYHKVMTLLSQNVKKGTRDILKLLTEEETEALQLKREIAKRKGEEAGTKLLFPMILELAVVMIIVIAPALMGF